jgi:hypothetical protein
MKSLRASARVSPLLLLSGLLANCAHVHCEALVTRTSPWVMSSSEPPACACARSALLERFRTSEIDAIVQRIEHCVGPAGSSQLWENRACFPLEFGTDAENGEKVQLSFACGDVCPENADIAIAYSRPRSEAECKKIGGMTELTGVVGVYTRCRVATPEACRAPTQYPRE